MTLFTKEGCEKCDYVKKSVDLKKIGVRVEILGPDNPDSLAHLAWHGLVRIAETQLPILVLDDSSSLTGAIRIKNYLASTGERVRAENLRLILRQPLPDGFVKVHWAVAPGGTVGASGRTPIFGRAAARPYN